MADALQERTEPQVAEEVRERLRLRRRALDDGFSAMKLKVGSDDSTRDVRRVGIVRDLAGENVKLMVDCNQQWTLPS